MASPACPSHKCSTKVHLWNDTEGKLNIYFVNQLRSTHGRKFCSHVQKVSCSENLHVRNFSQVYDENNNKDDVSSTDGQG